MSPVTISSAGARRIKGAALPPPVSGLSVHPSGRYLTMDGTPFIAVGDSPWSLVSNCTNAQIDAFVADRAAKGCTALLFEMIERTYTNQTPAYLNVDGVAPFTSMSPINWTLNDTYWDRVDHAINACLAEGIVCFVTPAYTGYGDGSDGWRADYDGESNATLQAYGEALATRYTQKNIVWVLGGDDANDLGASGAYGSGTTPDRTKQWQIALGIISVNPNAIITGHTARNGAAGAVDGEAWKAWGDGYTGWNLNNVYAQDGGGDAPVLADAAYGRSGPIPFFLIEAGYEDTDGTNGGGRVPAYQTIFRGGLGGVFGGHDALWHMGSQTPNTGAQSVLDSYLASSWTDYQHLASLLSAHPWYLLEPKLDTSLVTSALGSGASAVCPALASNGASALIYVPSSQTVTIDKSALSPSTLRVRLFNTATGAYTIHTASTANTGTLDVATGGERVIVVDAA